jgi:hypothetical protein
MARNRFDLEMGCVGAGVWVVEGHLVAREDGIWVISQRNQVLHETTSLTEACEWIADKIGK